MEKKIKRLVEASKKLHEIVGEILLADLGPMDPKIDRQLRKSHESLRKAISWVSE